MSVTVTEPVNIEVLKERFPSEVINPYGEVLVIPSRLFQRGWEPELERQGYKVYAGVFNNESSFFIRLSKPITNVEKPNTILPQRSNVETPLKKRKKLWTLEEETQLKEMIEKGMSNRDITKVLNRTRVSIQGKAQRMNLTQTRFKVAGSEPPNASVVTPNPIISGDDVVKELLVAASVLYPQHRRACRILLLETSRLLEAQK